MAGALTVDCPTCARTAEYSERNPWRPFCSERCRNLDLGAWASESFRIDSMADPAEGDDESTGSPSVSPRG